MSAARSASRGGPEALAPRLFRALHLGVVRRLLASEGLPHEDLTEPQLDGFLAVGACETPDGIVGVEVSGGVALLRSLVVVPAARRRGLATMLVNAAEVRAAELGAGRIYLLTTTAAGFFSQRGYREIGRDSVPKEIVRSAEFSQLCPLSATLMTKSLPARPG